MFSQVKLRHYAMLCKGQRGPPTPLFSSSGRVPLRLMSTGEERAGNPVHQQL